MDKKTRGSSCITGTMRKRLALGLALILMVTAPAAWAAEGWRREGLPGLFICEIPRDWWAGDMMDKAGEAGRSFKGGLLHIRVEHLAFRGPGPRTPQEYLTRFEPDSRKFVPGEPLEVSGRPAPRWSRGYTVRPRTPRGSGPENRVYEEIVFLEVSDGFWALRFTSNTALHRQEAPGLEIWRHFLKSFRLL